MLADRVRSRRDVRRTADPVSLEEFGYLLGRAQGGNRSSAGITVDPMRALGITAWWSGVRYLAESVEFLPVKTFRGKQGDRVQRADPSWLRVPDVDTPWAAVLEHWVMSLLHRGNAYAAKLRNPVGVVTGLRPVHPDRVKPGRTSEGYKVFEVKNGDGSVLALTSRELLHIPFLSYDGVCGLDPIRVHAQALGLAAAADEYAAKQFGQGSHLRAYVSVPQTLTTDQADEIRGEWERLHNGMTATSAFGVLGNGATYNTVSLDPQQVQLLESRKFSVTEVARILRLPPPKLYDLERATFSNIEQQAIDAVTDGIRPLVERIETYVNFDSDLTPPGNFIEHQFEGLLRGDAKSEAEAMAAAINGGWMTPKRAAEIKNLPAPDELDYWLRPLNMAVIREGQDAENPSTSEPAAPGPNDPPVETP